MAKTTPVTETVTVHQFVGRKYGKTFIATLGKESFSKNVTTEEWETLKKEMDAYNKKPSEARKKKIVKLLTPDKVAAKEKEEKKVAAVKGIKQQIKKEVKRAKKEVKEAAGFDFMAEFEKAAQQEGNVEKLQEILNKYKKVEAKVVPAPVQQTRRWGGEH